MFIYKTTNLINGKIYIGKRQLDIHGYLGSGTVILRAIEKYGRENFIREIIEDGIEDPKILNEREHYWVLFYKSNDPKIGYNLTEGGDGSWGYTMSDESRKKISDNHADVSGENHPMYGRNHTDDAKKLISQKNTGKIRSEEFKKNQSERMIGENNPMYGKKHTQEVQDRISKINFGRKSKNSSSKYRGVYWNIQYSKWTGSFRNEKNVFLGYFHTESEAAIAVNNEIIKGNIDWPINEVEEFIVPKTFFIISEYNNDISWVEDYTKNYLIFDKSNTLPNGPRIIKQENKGHNIFDSLLYIYKNYRNLPETMAFLQGNPWDHVNKEDFEKSINNVFFTPLESYLHVPESSVHKKDPNDNFGYMEINSSWYLYLKSPYEHKFFNTYDDFMNTFFSNYNHLNWIRFSPGAQYIVPRENILYYTKNFYKKLIKLVDYAQYTCEAHLLERTFYYIFSNTYKERILE